MTEDTRGQVPHSEIEGGATEIYVARTEHSADKRTCCVAGCNASALVRQYLTDNTLCGNLIISQGTPDSSSQHICTDTHLFRFVRVPEGNVAPVDGRNERLVAIGR